MTMRIRSRLLFCRILLVFIIVTCACFYTSAEVIILKSGKTIEGKVVEHGKDFLKIDISGIPLTYYFEDIVSVDGRGISVYLAGGSSTYGAVPSYNTGAKPMGSSIYQIGWPTESDSSYAQGLSEWTKWSMNSSVYMLKLQSIANSAGATYKSLADKFLRSSSAGEQENAIKELRDLMANYLAQVSALTPPADLTNYHAKMLESIRAIQDMLASAYSTDAQAIITKLSKIKATTIAALQELKSVCKAHQAPASFIAALDSRIAEVEAQTKNI
ncbi:MAG: hypothetical protein PHQ96_08835 [Candidatus Omnitrophica bacterium]|nr:hypothetical protein [Candidatus Omnitrophota bacterium]